MKDFLKMTLAVVCGLFIMGVLSMFLFFGSIASLATLSESSETILPRSGVLKIDMSKYIISEQAKTEDFFQTLYSNQEASPIGLYNVVNSIKYAANDPTIEYIYLKTDGMAIGQAKVQEVRKALEYFKSKGKPVISYIENPSTGSYYLASVGDKVYIDVHRGGTSTFLGVSSQMYFIKDLLDLFGVNVQLIRHGKYKSAGEMFVRNNASKANLEQTQTMITSLWNAYANEIAASRSISVEDINSALDNLKLLYPEDYVSCKLADATVTTEELQEKLTTYAGNDNFKDVTMISLKDYAKFVSNNSKRVKTTNEIAIIYADGEIVDGTGKQNIAGQRFADEIEKIRKDDNIKAVVLRVNSPGGSVYASEKIRTQLDLLHEVKPIVASYGDYAASGGYWISNGCDYIYANPATLTGSIGVFAMIPEFSKTAKDLLHVNVTSVSSNKHGDLLSLMRPFTPEETNFIQASIEDIYSRFVSLVSEGRGLTKERVDEIAQGRVWAGLDAINIGLIDEFGTLDDAIEHAKILANSKIQEEAEEDGKAKFSTEYKIVGYPKQLTPAEAIMELFNKFDSEASANAEIMKAFNNTPMKNIAKAYSDLNLNSKNIYYARMPYQYNFSTER